jgi:hypothetical protein
MAPCSIESAVSYAGKAYEKSTIIPLAPVSSRAFLIKSFKKETAFSFLKSINEASKSDTALVLKVSPFFSLTKWSFSCAIL